MNLKYKFVPIISEDETFTSVIYMISLIIITITVLGSVIAWALPPDILARAALLAVAYYLWYINTIDKRHENA